MEFPEATALIPLFRVVRSRRFLLFVGFRFLDPWFLSRNFLRGEFHHEDVGPRDSAPLISLFSPPVHSGLIHFHSGISAIIR